jgi:hypothetical protein
MNQNVNEEIKMDQALNNIGTINIEKFLEDKAPDHKGRKVSDILKFSNKQMEEVHDFIQWAFPLHEKSLHSLVSPVITSDIAESIKNNPVAQENIEKLYKRFREFLNLDNNINNWCFAGNHNLLRVTRAIRSLRLLGRSDLARILYADCLLLAKKNNVNSNTLDYWYDAMHSKPFDSMTKRFLKIKELKLE